MTRNFGAKLRFVKSRPWAGRQRHKPQTPAGIGALGLPHTGLIWAKAYVGIPGATQVTTGSTHTPPSWGTSQRYGKPRLGSVWNERKDKWPSDTGRQTGQRAEC